jgi:hypothetical protein
MTHHCCADLKLSATQWLVLGQGFTVGTFKGLKVLNLNGMKFSKIPMSHHIYADSRPTPQFRGMLLEALYHGALSVDVKLKYFDGPFDRSNDDVFKSLPSKINTFNKAFSVRLSGAYFSNPIIYVYIYIYLYVCQCIWFLFRILA